MPELGAIYIPVAALGMVVLSVPLLAVLRSSGSDPRRMELPIRPSILRMCSVAAIIWVTLLPSLAAVTNYGRFRNPDVYAYDSDSDTVRDLGALPPAGALRENLYYEAFPVYLLILHTASETSGMTPLEVVYVVSWAFQLLFWAFAVLTARRLLPESLRGGNPALPLSIVVVAFSNVYLNAYFGGVVPSAAAQAVAIMLAYLTLSPRTWKTSVLFILAAVLALVHISTIPVAMAIILLTYILGRRERDGENPRVVRTNFRPSRIVLPTVLFVSYTALTVALVPVADYAQKIWAFVNSLIGEAVAGEAAFSTGVSRGLLAPIHAVAPAFLGAACIGGLALAVGRPGKYPRVLRPLLGAIAIVSLTAAGLGVLRQRFAAQAYFSVARYLSLPGFAFASLLALVVVTLVFSSEVKSVSARRLRLLLLLVSILAAVGGLLDPFAFGYG